MIQKAAYLVQARGWDYDLLSRLHLALAVSSPWLPATYPMNIFCSIGGKAWGLLIMCEFIVEASRSEAIHEALLRLSQFCAPAELEVWPRPECFIRYTVDLDIEDDVETHLGCAIDEALAQMDMARMVLQLVNWGRKSTDAAIAQVNSSELEMLRAAKLARMGNAG
jgi:hypothetical protein